MALVCEYNETHTHTHTHIPNIAREAAVVLTCVGSIPRAAGYFIESQIGFSQGQLQLGSLEDRPL